MFGRGQHLRVLSSACSGRLELALGNLEALAAYLRDIPGGALSRRIQRPDATHLGGRDRDADRARRARATRAHYLEHLRGDTATRLGGPRGPSPVAARCRGPARCRRGQTGRRDAPRSSAPSPMDWAALPARARPHAALPGSSAAAGAAEERGAGGARAGARDLRGAGRAAVGGEGACGAAADQRPCARVRGADRDRAAGRRAGGAGAARTRRSRPSSSWG